MPEREKPRISDLRIRAAIEGPFIGYECANRADAIVFAQACRQVGALHMVYHERHVAVSAHGEPIEELEKFLARVKSSVSPEIMVVAPKQVGFAQPTLVDCILLLHEQAGLMYEPASGRIVDRPKKKQDVTGPETMPDLGRQELLNPEAPDGEEVPSL